LGCTCGVDRANGATAATGVEEATEVQVDDVA